ncbi:MAG TPA: hypothetical protein DDZ80_15825 [Cyanobacteria bacterium UBA8803]|nr:hypothetical protein [Cyanobacteria bacterium UBA9273]HBL59885.1 hypothetical protein [Cyanobacteria bacterium UBA8803]
MLPEAIASLINRSLQPQGITAKVSIRADTLRIMIEAQQVDSSNSSWLSWCVVRRVSAELG